MIWLDICSFCGFKRKMEIAESNLQPLVTVHYLPVEAMSRFAEANRLFVGSTSSRNSHMKAFRPVPMMSAVLSTTSGDLGWSKNHTNGQQPSPGYSGYSS